MEREENKFFKYLKWRYWVRFGWELSIEKAPQGVTASITVRPFDLVSISYPTICELRSRLEDVGVVTGVEECGYSRIKCEWTIDNPVGALRVLASFIKIPLSDAKARLLWLGK